MRLLISILLFILAAGSGVKPAHSEALTGCRTVHIYVALCDNKFQGIVPVSPVLGDGKDPARNLYWGAYYGVKSYFARSKDWRLVKTGPKPRFPVLECCIFAHKDKNVYLIADAYDGEKIKDTVIDFLTACAGGNKKTLRVEGKQINAGGSADLAVYIGHDGLMDFSLPFYPKKMDQGKRECIILACYSKKFFKEAVRVSGARPLLWTTGLLAPEGYVLEGALAGWVENETGEMICDRAAAAYHKYQKCGLGAAKRLFATGW